MVPSFFLLVAEDTEFPLMEEGFLRLTTPSSRSSMNGSIRNLIDSIDLFGKDRWKFGETFPVLLPILLGLGKVSSSLERGLKSEQLLST